MEEPPSRCPQPSPLLTGPQHTPSLALTPERPSHNLEGVSSSAETTLSSAGTLSSVGREGRLEHRLAHPSVNSSRKLELRLAELDKENNHTRPVQLPLDSVLPSEEDTTKVVSVERGVQVFRNLVSVDVSLSHRPPQPRAAATATRGRGRGRGRSDAEGPDIFEFFSKEMHLSEEASWEFSPPEEDRSEHFTTLEQFQEKSEHLWNWK